MDTSTNFTKTYVLNGEVVEFDSIPKDASYQCVHENNGQVMYIEVFELGDLLAIENYGEEDDVLTKAQETLWWAVKNEVNVDLEAGTGVNIYFSAENYEFGLPITDNQACTIKAKFMARYDDNGELVIEVEQHHGAYMAEIMELEPVPRLLKRTLYNAAKELMFIEYPLYALNLETGLPVELYCFSEATVSGEKLILSDMDEESMEGLADGSIYIPMANRDELLALVNPYIDKKAIHAADMQQQPIAEEDLPDHSEIFLLSFDDQDNIQTLDYVVAPGVAHSEIFSVPLDKHWHVFHAYVRKMQADMVFLSVDPLKATHYIHIHSPIYHEAIEEVPLEEGQYRMHTSTFHLNGNLISHDCKVFSSEHSLVNEVMMTSPTTLEVFSEELIDFNDLDDDIDLNDFDLGDEAER